MRLMISLIFAVSAGSAVAEPATPPTYDVTQACRTQVDYAFAATLGDVDVSKELKICAARENDQKGSVEALWPLASDTDRSECLNISEGRYSYLARCLAGSRSVRATR